MFKFRQSPWWRLLSRLFNAGMILFVFGYLARNILGHWDELRTIAWFRHPLLLAVHGILHVMIFGGFVLVWGLLLRFAGDPVSLTGSAYSWLIPNLGKYLPGKVFMIAGRVEFCRKLGIRRATSLSATALEQVIQLLSAFPFILAAIVAGLNLHRSQLAVLLGAVLLPGAVLLTRPALFIGLFNVILTRFKRAPIEVAPRAWQMLLLTAITFGAWVCYGASGAALIQALDLGGSGLPASRIIMAFVSSWMIGFLSMLTPGGLGVREGILVLLLTPQLTPAQASLVALISRLTWTVVEMGGVLLGMALGKKIDADAAAKTPTDAAVLAPGEPEIQ